MFQYQEIDLLATDLSSIEALEKQQIGEEVLSIESLQKYYEVDDTSITSMLKKENKRYVKANESLSFKAHSAETVAVVGESGCGKSTLAKVLMGIETASSGQALLNGEDIAHTHVTKRRSDQTSAMQMVFQNPFDTLNPSLTIGSQLARVIRKFGVSNDDDEIQAKVMQIMPIMFTFMFAFFPSGLVLYWLTNTILSFSQQWHINKAVASEGQKNIPKNKNKKPR